MQRNGSSKQACVLVYTEGRQEEKIYESCKVPKSSL
jgi:hypothetical protein